VAAGGGSTLVSRICLAAYKRVTVHAARRAKDAQNFCYTCGRSSRRHIPGILSTIYQQDGGGENDGMRTHATRTRCEEGLNASGRRAASRMADGISGRFHTGSSRTPRLIVRRLRQSLPNAGKRAAAVAAFRSATALPPPAIGTQTRQQH